MHSNGLDVVIDLENDDIRYRVHEEHAAVTFNGEAGFHVQLNLYEPALAQLHSLIGRVLPEIRARADEWTAER
ncbi:hypothetical protein [Actinokineospora enzanensis]|uniref:hypothetical protein n=1 Tax=Actinokineospora enzanensis TaxID=155975 RepID=UPI00037E64AD|nr:hypothetical protein [Actinokineospora enzanensis]